MHHRMDDDGEPVSEGQPYFEAIFLGGPGLLPRTPVLRRVGLVQNEHRQWTVPDALPATEHAPASSGQFVLEDERTWQGRPGYVWRATASPD